MNKLAIILPVSLLIIIAVLLIVLWKLNILAPRYSCNGKTCVGDCNGNYKTINCDGECSSLAAPTPYSCINGACVRNPTGKGQFSDSKCGNGCFTCLNGACATVADNETSGTFQDCSKCSYRYSCQQGACTLVDSGTGQYDNATCNSGCNLCESGQCSPVPDNSTVPGRFATCTGADCGSYSCINSGDPTKACVLQTDGKGEFSSATCSGGCFYCNTNTLGGGSVQQVSDHSTNGVFQSPLDNKGAPITYCGSSCSGNSCGSYK